MQCNYKELIRNAYVAFNERRIDGVLALMHVDVHWPNGWEVGFLNGQIEVRNYWQRQFKELNPNVVPVAFLENQKAKSRLTSISL